MIPQRLQLITQGLRSETWMQRLLLHYEVFIVGGTVRDAYRDEDIKDIDLVVEGPKMADLKEFLRPFGRVNEVGESFAVIKFRPHGHEGEDFDVAVPRIDTKIGEGHKDFIVETDGIKLEEDLERRDFTINSIAINVANDDLIDLFRGRMDIEKGLIRATDQNAFTEDPLRILRGLQFSARFGYEIEQETMMLMQNHAHEVKRISGERIFEELMKVLNKHGDTQKALSLLYETDVDKALFDKKMLTYDKGMDNLDPISFFYTLGILGDFDPGDFIRQRLKGDKKLEKNVRALDKMFIMLPEMLEEEDMLYMLSKAFTKSPDIMDATIIPEAVEEIVLKMRLQKIPRGLEDIMITGDDILYMNPSLKGKEIGILLERILRDALMNRFDWKNYEKSLKYLGELIYKN